MAFSNNSTSRGPGPSTLAEINVTPLVDVMLVLLIVFMISAPLMQQGIQVDLPKANAGTLTEVPDQIVLIVNKDHKMQLGEVAVKPEALRARLEAMVAAKPQIEVFIHADQSVNYGYVAQVMAEVKKAKINRVGLVTEPADPNAKL